MRPLKRVSIGILIIFYISSCTTIPFTTVLRNEYALNNDDVKQLQYYISDRIVMQRELTGEEAGSMTEITSGHTLKKVKGKYVEEIVIMSRTPCIVVGTVGTSLKIAFEEGDHLIFEPLGSLGKYYLRGRFSGVTGKTAIRYAGKTYMAVSGDPTSAHLLVDEETLGKFEKDSRVLPGMQLESP